MRGFSGDSDSWSVAEGSVTGAAAVKRPGAVPGREPDQIDFRVPWAAHGTDSLLLDDGDLGVEQLPREHRRR